MSASLVRRTIVAAIAIPTVFALVYVGSWALAAALAVVGLLGSRELFRLARAHGGRPLAGLGYLGAAVAPFAVLVAVRTPVSWIAYAGLIWMIVVMADAVFRRSPDEQPLHAIAVTVFGVAYTGILPAFLLVLRHAGPWTDPLAATWLVFLPLVVTWVCDSMAMAGGALIGGAKLAPVISPKKTWAGTVSGSLFATIVAPVYGMLVLSPAGVSVGWWRLALFGFVVSVVGQIGDLAESLLKRAAGVKDSGTLLPGHGGALDRLDSLYWVLPISAFILTLYGIL